MEQNETRTETGKTEMGKWDRKRRAVGPIWACPLRSSSVMRTEMGGPKWARTEMGGHRLVTPLMYQPVLEWPRGR